MLNKDGLLNLSSRKQVYNLITKYPGLHLREIYRKLDISNGAIRYHIDYLKKRNLITDVYENGYRRYFINQNIDRETKKLIVLLREEVPRKIILYLLFAKFFTKSQICKDLKQSPNAVEYAIKKLKNEELIIKTKAHNGLITINHREIEHVEFDGKTKEFIYIVSDYNKLNDFFIINKDWFFDKLTKDLIEYSIEIDKKKYPEKLMSFNKRWEKSVDNSYRVLTEIFPNPYYI